MQTGLGLARIYSYMLDVTRMMYAHREVFAAVETRGEAKWRTLLDALLQLLKMLTPEASTPAMSPDMGKAPEDSRKEQTPGPSGRIETVQAQDEAGSDDRYKLVRTIAVLASCWRLGEDVQIVTVGREDNVRVLMHLLKHWCVKWRQLGEESHCAAALAIIDILRKYMPVCLRGTPE
jgi:hypothetical protein